MELFWQSNIFYLVFIKCIVDYNIMCFRWPVQWFIFFCRLHSIIDYYKILKDNSLCYMFSRLSNPVFYSVPPESVCFVYRFFIIIIFRFQYISDITEYLSLSDISLTIMFSKSIHVAPNGNIKFFLWLSNIPLHTHTHIYHIFLSQLSIDGQHCYYINISFYSVNNQVSGPHGTWTCLRSAT